MNDEIYYLVKWENVSIEYSTWEPLENLQKFEKRINEYNKKLSRKLFNDNILKKRCKYSIEDVGKNIIKKIELLAEDIRAITKIEPSNSSDLTELSHNDIKSEINEEPTSLSNFGTFNHDIPLKVISHHFYDI